MFVNKQNTSTKKYKYLSMRSFGGFLGTIFFFNLCYLWFSLWLKYLYINVFFYIINILGNGTVSVAECQKIRVRFQGRIKYLHFLQVFLLGACKKTKANEKTGCMMASDYHYPSIPKIKSHKSIASLWVLSPPET